MSYKEQLLKAKQITPYISEIIVAWEVECQMGIDRPDFEDICVVAYDMYLDIDGVSVCQVVDAIDRLITNGMKVNEISKEDVIDNIVW